MKIFKNIFRLFSGFKGGFSMFEAALSMAIFASILTVGLTNYALKKDSDEIGLNARKLEQLKDAIDDFVSANGYLPCPARGDLKSNESSYMMEARDAGTGYCNTSVTGIEKIDSDSAVTYGDGNFTVDVTYDFVKGVPPCRTLGLSSNCATDKYGNRFSYIMSNPLATTTPCTKYLKDDLSLEERPYTLKILKNADAGDSLSVNYSNYGKYSDTADEPTYALVSHGKDGVGAYNSYGTKNAAKEVSTGTFLDNYFQALNHHAYSGANLRYLLSPEQPLETPSATVVSEVKPITFGDVVVWGRPSGQSFRICSHCRQCDATYKNDTVQTLAFVDCSTSLEPVCGCTQDSECDQGAGECCNTISGACGAAYCTPLTVACSSSGSCNGGNVPYSGPTTVYDCNDVTADIAVGTVLFTGTTTDSGLDYRFIYDGVQQDGTTCLPKFKIEYDYICTEITTSPAIDGFTDNQKITHYTPATSGNVYGASYAASSSSGTLTYSATSSGGVGILTATMNYTEGGANRSDTYVSDVTNSDTYNGYTYEMIEGSATTYDCPIDSTTFTVACDGGGCTQGSDAVSYSGAPTVGNCGDVDDDTDLAPDTVVYSGTNGDGVDWEVKYMGSVVGTAPNDDKCYAEFRWYPTLLCDYITTTSTAVDTSSVYYTSQELYGNVISGYGMTLAYNSGTPDISYTFTANSSSSGGSVGVSDADSFRYYTIDASGGDLTCPTDVNECSSHAHCSGGEKCCANNCVSDTTGCSCTGDSDCAGTQTCSGGTCQEPACSQQSECSPTKRCCGSSCTTSTPCSCDADNDCLAGEYCCGGTCNTTCSCTVRTDCPDTTNQRCCNSSSGGTCTTSTPCSCDADEDCKSGEACIGGVCGTAGGSCSTENECGIAECCCSTTSTCSLTCSYSVGSSGGTDCADTFTNIRTFQSTSYGYAGADTFTINDSGSSGGVKIYGGNGDDTSYFNYVGTYCEENRGTCTQVSKCNVAGTSGSSCDGNDIIYSYGSGTDTIYAGVGNDTIYAGPSSDIAVYGGDGNDTIYGEAGNDELYGEAGDDYINLGAAGYIAYAGAGNDTVIGGTDGGYCYGHEGNDNISECEYYYPGDGNDTTSNSTSNGLRVCEAIISTCSTVNCTVSVPGTYCTGDDTISTGGGNDFIAAGPGSDTITAGAGTDTIHADGSGTESSSETNSIYPGNGNDTITASNGNDYFYVTGTWGADGIISFNGTYDRIYVDDVAPGSLTVTKPTTCNSVSSSTLISYSGNTICVRGTTAVYTSSGSQNVFQY